MNYLYKSYSTIGKLDLESPLGLLEKSLSYLFCLYARFLYL